MLSENFMIFTHLNGSSNSNSFHNFWIRLVSQTFCLHFLRSYPSFWPLSAAEQRLLSYHDLLVPMNSNCLLNEILKRVSISQWFVVWIYGRSVKSSLAWATEDTVWSTWFQAFWAFQTGGMTYSLVYVSDGSQVEQVSLWRLIKVDSSTCFESKIAWYAPKFSNSSKKIASSVASQLSNRWIDFRLSTPSNSWRAFLYFPQKAFRAGPRHWYLNLI